MLYFNSPAEALQNLRPINPNLNDYHSNPMAISSIFWILDMTDWWRQQENMHSKYSDLSNVAWETDSIVPYAVGVEARFSLGQMLSAGGSQKPQATPFAKMTL
jgi:hypothetical protein